MTFTQKNIKQRHFLKVIAETGPSVTLDMTKYYEVKKGELRIGKSKKIEAHYYI